jgi:hypothetical protein
MLLRCCETGELMASYVERFTSAVAVLRDSGADGAVVWRMLFMLFRCCEIRKLLLQLCGGGYLCCCGAAR